jgi:hypothetical protein
MPNLLNAVISTSSSGDNSIIAAAGGTTCIRIHRVVIVNNVATAQAIIVKDGTTAVTGTMGLPSSIGGGLVLGDMPGTTPLWVLSQNAAFTINLSAATSVGGFVTYSLG